MGYTAVVRRPNGTLDVQLGNVWTYEAARARLAWAESSETLRAELPTANGGTTTPAAAQRCLDELALFKAEARWVCIQLVDDDNDAVVRTYEWSNEAIFSADELYAAPLGDWTLHEFTINALIAVLTASVEDGLPVEWQ